MVRDVPPPPLDDSSSLESFETAGPMSARLRRKTALDRRTANDLDDSGEHDEDRVWLGVDDDLICY